MKVGSRIRLKHPVPEFDLEAGAVGIVDAIVPADDCRIWVRFACGSRLLFTEDEIGRELEVIP